MSQHFFNTPILNSPYAPPANHWELDANGQPTDQIVAERRRSSLVSPIPKPKKLKGKGAQAELDATADAAGVEQEYNPTETINGIRSAVESWRTLPESQWNVTPTTARLLRHWRTHHFANQRPFLCQVEAVETAIWLIEVAPRASAQGRRFWAHLEAANTASNPELMRLALKLATGAGKTTVMAMLIAWQTVNTVCHPDAKRFTKGFLIVAPGVTIKDRLRVLQPNDPDSYYRSREIVPEDKGGVIEPSSADDIAVWFVDTDYDYKGFFVRHAYFPGQASNPYKSLRTTLKAKIDEEAWASLKRIRSRPFPRPTNGRVAVKVISHLGDEVMKVVGV